MKNLALFTLLLLSFVCTSVTAQDVPAPIDSTLSIEFPHKMELQRVGGLFWRGVSVYNVRYTESDSRVKKYCRISVVESDGVRIREDAADFTGEQIEYFKEDLGRLYVIAKSDKPATYVSYRNRIPGKLNYYMEYGDLIGWSLWINVDRVNNRIWKKLPIGQLPEFAKTLDVCIGFIQR